MFAYYLKSAIIGQLPLMLLIFNPTTSLFFSCVAHFSNLSYVFYFFFWNTIFFSVILAISATSLLMPTAMLKLSYAIITSSCVMPFILFITLKVAKSKCAVMYITIKVFCRKFTIFWPLQTVAHIEFTP